MESRAELTFNNKYIMLVELDQLEIIKNTNANTIQKHISVQLHQLEIIKNLLHVTLNNKVNKLNV